MVETHPNVEQLQAFVAGRLGEGPRAAVEAHLLDCEGCWAVVEETESALPIAELLKTLPAELRARIAGAGCGSRPTTPQEEQPPAELRDHPRYRVLECVGQGGMGVVWKARHLLMNRTVALKVIRPALLRSASAAARFRREVEAAARLDHPNIVRAYDAEEVKGVHFLIMEFVEGADLARLVRERGPLPVAEACEYARQAALALRHADERGMVHRDIKPHNLMRTPEGVVKVLDFGLAAFLASEEVSDQTVPSTEDPSVTRLAEGCGTPDYISPEQVRDSRAVDIRADIYSLGCTLYHLLAGKPPFAGGTGYSKVAKHLERTPRRLSEVRADLPPALLEVLDRMLAKEPKRRFQTPGDVAEALAPFAVGELPQQGSRLSRRRLLMGAVAGVGAIAGGWWLWGRRVPRAREVRRLAGHADGIHCVALSRDSRLALSGSKDRTLRLWSVEAGEEVRRLEGHKGVVWSVAFLPDGKRAVSGTSVGEVWLWDLETGKRLRAYQGHNPDQVLSLCVSADGRRVMSSGGPLCVWETESTNPTVLTEDGDQGTYCVQFLAGGRQAVSGNSGEQVVRWWDVEKRRLIHRFPPHPHGVEAVGVSADETLLLAGCYNRVGVLWDLKTLREVSRFNLAHRPYRVWPNGGGFWVVLNDDQSTLSVWELPAQREVCRLVNENGAVQWGCVLSEDRRLVVTGSHDGFVRVWELPDAGWS